jgi:hypothetical protein
MKTTIPLSTLITLLSISTTVFATCYSKGDSFPDKELAKWHAQRACEGYDGNAGAFQGNYNPGQVKYACIQVSTTIKLELSVQNLNNRDSFDLRDADCTWRLQDEINGCFRGGESSISGWFFR